MYCKFCGVSLPEDINYCPECGVQLNREVSKEKNQLKCWNVFAKLGYGLGLGGLISSCVPILYIFIIGMQLSSFGLVFSILGLRSKNPKAQKGKKISIAGLIVSTIYLLIFITFIIHLIVEGTYVDYNDATLYY